MKNNKIWNLSLSPVLSSTKVKSNNYKNVILVFLFVISSAFSFAQTTYDAAFNSLNFGGTNKTNKVGNGENENDIVLYSNIITINGQEIDAVVETVTIDNLNDFDNYDDNGSNSAFFSPKLDFKNGGGYVIFNFSFIIGDSYVSNSNIGTLVKLKNFYLNTYDIDGNGRDDSNQYNEFQAYSSYELGDPTNLSISTNTVQNFIKFRSISDQNFGTTTDPRTRVRLTFANPVSNLRVKVGAEASWLAYFFLDFSVGSNFNTAVSTQITDTDGDGVEDSLDNCANTPSGTTVDASGCPVVQSDPTSSSILIAENLTAFTACGGSNSEEQNFTVSGLSLLDDITVTAPTNWQVSATTGTGFLDEIIIPQTGGSVYIRLKDDAASGSVSGNVTIASTGVTPETISVAGVVNQGTVVGSSGASSLNVNDVSITVDDAIVVNGTGTVTNAQVFISSGFLVGDVLEYTATLPSGVTKNYNTTTGVLTFTGTISLTDLQSIFRNIHIKTTVNNTQDRIVTFLAGNALPFADNNHYYEFKTASGISWTAAKTAAEALTFNGLQGYLATITSAEENAFIVSKLAGQGWFGAADSGVEGQWEWMTGPEAGTQFWQGTSSGSSVGGLYSNWSANEPNDYRSGEDYAHFITSGQWNDFPLTSGSIVGYVVEYGGMPNDPCVSISDSKVVNVTSQPFFNNNSSVITSFTSCVGSNSPEQTFTVSGLNLSDNIIITAPTNWQVSATTGSGFSDSVTLSQASGAVATTTVYIRLKDDAASGSVSGNVTIASTGATTETISVTGTVNLVPQPLTVSNSLCAESGLEWVSFNTVSSTTGTGTLFGNITATVTHSDGGMQSWYMYNQTSFPSEYNVPTSNNIRNDKAGTFTISFSEPVTNPQVAFASIGNPSTPVGITTSDPYQVIWNGLAMDYSTSTSMTGNEGFTIVSFPGTHSSLTFDYLNDEAYVTMAFGAQNPNCNNITICEGDSVTLNASGGSTYAWSPSNGLNTTSGAQVIASPSVTTTYSVIDTSNSCAAPTEVVITVLPPPSAPTVSTSGTQLMCTGETVADLEATVSNGETIEWFATATGGTALASSTVLVGGTSYYAQATNANGCSSSRTALTAVTNNALHFDGVNDYVSLTNTTIQDGATAFTIEAWIKPDSSNYDSSYHAIFGNQQGGTANSRNPSIYFKDAKIYLDTYENGSITRFEYFPPSTQPIVFTENNWSHIALVKDGNQYIIYVNGVVWATAPAPTAVNITGPYQFGKIDNYFAGQMDEVRFWGDARTASEILTNMNESLTGNETDLLGYYNFNQGIANGTNTSVTTITDLTSNANTGTLNNLSLAGTSSNWVKGYFTEITGAEEVTLGDTLQLNNLTSDGVWSSSDTAVATISQTGLVTPITPGVTTITYTYCGVTTTHQVTVNGYPTISTITDQSNCPNTETNAFTFTISDQSTPLADLVLTGTSSNTNLIANNAIVFGGSGSNRTVTITPISGQLGTSTITITVTNDYNLDAVETFVLTIEDLIDPTVTTAPVAVAVNTDADLPTASNVALGTPVFSDNCGTPTVTNDAPSVFPIGVTTVTWTATDTAGNTVTTTQTVTVTDTEKPVISDTPLDITKSNDVGICGAEITWTAPTASDNAAIATFVSTHASGDEFPVGTTTVTYTATDSSGNETTTSFDVTVTDTEKPVITNTPAAISQNNDTGVNGAVVTWTLPTASDNCAIDTFVSSKESGDEFPIGTTTVTYTATDIYGNETTTSFNVTVTDTEKPVISDTPLDITKSNDAGICGAEITWTAPTASDNAAIATFVSTHTSGDEFPVGTTTVTYTATDSSGNETTTSFDVTVTDTEKPVIITLPIITAIDYVSDSGQCGANIFWSEPEVTDNCSIANIEQTHESGDFFFEGDTTITYTITDVHGNETTTSIVVTVEASMLDCDGDGVTNSQELIDGTDPRDLCSSLYENMTMSVRQDYLDADCDADGLTNGEEIGTDAKNPIDSDNDGIADYLEFNNYKPSSDELEIFSLMTPNGDGDNDVFVIRNIELYPENSLEIFNRWGAKVYDVKGYGQNGRYFEGLSDGKGTIDRNSLLPTGTYFYILKYTSKTGELKNRKGYLYLTR